MPIIDLIKSRYKWNADTKGEYICEYNGLCPKKSYYKQVGIKKSRTTFNCRACSKERGKGIRFIGDHWNKICQFCLKEWIKNTKKSLQMMNEAVLDIEEDLIINQKKWYKEALVGALDIVENKNG